MNFSGAIINKGPRRFPFPLITRRGRAVALTRRRRTRSPPKSAPARRLPPSNSADLTTGQSAQSSTRTFQSFPYNRPPSPSRFPTDQPITTHPSDCCTNQCELPVCLQPSHRTSRSIRSLRNCQILKGLSPHTEAPGHLFPQEERLEREKGEYFLYQWFFCGTTLGSGWTRQSRGAGTIWREPYK
ncbi:uncharacterized protein O3Q21_009130 [Podargus strigoides]